jgi:hypothetical protein
MTNAAGYKSQASANRSFTSVGCLLAEYLSVPLNEDEGDSALDGSVVLGFRKGTETSDEVGNWIMHTELRDAVRAAF